MNSEIVNSSLKESRFYTLEMSNLQFQDCNLSGLEIIDTSFKNIDVSTCNIENLRSNIDNLKNMVISREQAMDLISIFGLITKN